MDLGKLIEKSARWYAARSWWADIDDLRNEGWVAALEAERTYKPEKGSKDNYLRRATWYRMRDFLWAQSAPVSGRRGHGEVLRGVHRASVDALYDHTTPDPVEMLEMEEWWAELREAVGQLVRTGKDGDIAARVLLDREKPGDIAKALEWPVHRVWRASSKARKRIGADIDLKEAVFAGA